MLLGKGGFPLHHFAIQCKDRTICHQPGASAHLKFHYPDALLFKQVPYNGIPVPAVGVVSCRRQKTLRVFLLRFVAVLVLEPQIPTLQKHGTLHFVGIHNLQDPFRGHLLGVPPFRDELTDGPSAYIPCPPPMERISPPAPVPAMHCTRWTWASITFMFFSPD